MKNISKLVGLVAAIGLTTTPTLVNAKRNSIPSVVITVENAAPSRGAFQTPFWVGIHDGSFDIYDRDVALGTDELVDAETVERLAEDGNTEPISEQFTISNPVAPQTTIFGPSGPFAPGDSASFTLNVNPLVDRYFSYASMVVPSNDAFIANGNPLAHELFDANGRFVGSAFSVAGTEVLDAGTEVNDEIAANTAFLNQSGPNIGTPENGVVTLHPGLAINDLTYPDGVLNHPPLLFADFIDPIYRAANFSFRYVDLGKPNLFRASLDADQEVIGTPVESDGAGRAFALSLDGDQVLLQIRFSGLTGPLVMAHFHNGAKGTNGPIVVNFSDRIGPSSILTSISSKDVIGPLGESDNPILALLNEMAAGNIYINLHTAANPGGEIRGQVRLGRTLKRSALFK